MRPLGAMLPLPVFGSSMLGGILIRNSLALALTLPSLPLIASLKVVDPMHLPGPFVVMLVSELIIGVFIGFSAAIPFWAMDAAGFVLDTLRGASMAGVLNPLLGGQSSPLGAFFSHLTAILFFALGGFHAFMSALYQSYVLLPPDGDWHWSEQFIPIVKSEWHMLYKIALDFALPATVMMVLIDLALGLINRSAQQLNVFSLSMPIKSVMALLMLIIGLQFGLFGIISWFENFDGGLARGLLARR